MGRATWVVSGIHRDRLYKALPPDLKLLYFQLLSHPDGNKAGFFQIDMEYHDLLRGGIGEEACRDELSTDTGLWFFDRSTDVVLIPTYLKYNKIGSAKTFQSMKFELEQLPKTRLCLEFIYRVNEYTEGKGLEYIPKKMMDSARAFMKQTKKLSIHEGIISKILLP